MKQCLFIVFIVFIVFIGIIASYNERNVSSFGKKSSGSGWDVSDTDSVSSFGEGVSEFLIRISESESGGGGGGVFPQFSVGWSEVAGTTGAERVLWGAWCSLHEYFLRPWEQKAPPRQSRQKYLTLPWSQVRAEHFGQYHLFFPWRQKAPPRHSRQKYLTFPWSQVRVEHIRQYHFFFPWVQKDPPRQSRHK